MFPNVEIYNEVLLNSIYEAIDLGIHVESEITSKGITRKITQIVAFLFVDHQPNSTLLFDIHQKIDLYSALNDRLKEKCQIKAPTRRKRHNQIILTCFAQYALSLSRTFRKNVPAFPFNLQSLKKHPAWLWLSL